jgi:hypothetical protein
VIAREKSANKKADREARFFLFRWESRSARSARTCARTGTRATTTATLTARTGAEYRLRLHRQQAFALQLLARQLACAAHGFRLLARLLLGGLFLVTAELHLAENPFALHLLLQRLEGLVDIIIANENLHAASSSMNRIGILGRQRATKGRISTSRAPMYQIGQAMSTSP